MNNSSEEERRLINEIVEKQKELEALQLKEASPVKKLFIEHQYEIKNRWTVVAVTVLVVLVAMSFGKHPRGFGSYFVDGAAWVLGIYYLFAGAPKIIQPLFDGCDAYKRSPDKNRELSLFLSYVAPSVIAICAVVAFFWFYLG